MSLKGRVRTLWFGGFFTTTTSRTAFSWEHPKDGAACMELVATQPPSCCSAVSRVLAPYFPCPRALSREQWVCGSRQTPRMLLLEGKEHLPHLWTAAQTLGLQLAFCLCSPSFEPPQSIQFWMHLMCSSCLWCPWAASRPVHIQSLSCLFAIPCSSCSLSAWPHT